MPDLYAAAAPPLAQADAQALADATPGTRPQSITTNIVGIPFATLRSLITEQGALTIPAFWRGMRFLTETLAGLPKHIARQIGTARERAPGHPLGALLNEEPNELCTAFTFWRTLYHHAIGWGNGYALIVKAGDRPTALYNLPPAAVAPFRADGRQWYAIHTPEGWIPCPAANILHIGGLGFDGQTGYPVVQFMAQSLGLSKSAEGFASKFYDQGGLVGGAIETDRILTPEQMADLKESVKREYSGLANAHKWLILQSGLKAHALTLPSASEQLLDTMQFSVLDIARTLGVPPHILYDLSRATWANIEHMGIEVVQYSLLPWIIPAEQEIRRKLLTPAERQAAYYCKFNADALQRGDHAQQIDSARKRLDAGLTTVNDELALMDRPPAGPEGEIRRVAANMRSLASLAAPPAPPPRPAPPPPPEDAEDAPPAQAAATRPTLADFAALLDDAAARVGAKTAKATITAQTKHAGDPQAFIVWGNVFAEGQARYAAAALAPILAVVSALGAETGREAEEIGRLYAARLRAHFSRLARNEPSEPPDLAAIIEEPNAYPLAT